MKRKHHILHCHPKSEYIEQHNFEKDYVCPICGKSIDLCIRHKRPKTNANEKISQIGFSCDNCGCSIGLYSVDSKMPLKDMIKIAEKSYNKWEFNRLRRKEQKRKNKKLKRLQTINSGEVDEKCKNDKS